MGLNQLEIKDYFLYNILKMLSATILTQLFPLFVSLIIAPLYLLIGVELPSAWLVGVRKFDRNLGVML